jgi:cation:H+ antiporter
MHLQTISCSCLDLLGRHAERPARLPSWVFPTAIFVVALGMTLYAAARYTRCMERLSEYEHLSPEILGFLSALGANIPNYVASLAAFAGGHGLLGIGIIVGSNIYNIAVILGLATLATPGRHGIALHHRAALEVRHLAIRTATMGGVMLVMVVISSAVPVSPVHHVLEVILNLVILALFALVIRDALRPDHSTDEAEGAHQSVSSSLPGPTWPSVPWRLILLAILALAITLVGVVVMVQAAQIGAAALNLSPIILSLVVLAIATSLPNTVVAYQLARTESAATSLDEILSSNAINLGLGCALPLLFWQITFAGGLLTRLDLPLLTVLGLTVMATIYTRRIPRWAGVGLFAVYMLWIAVHLLL